MPPLPLKSILSIHYFAQQAHNHQQAQSQSHQKPITSIQEYFPAKENTKYQSLTMCYALVLFEHCDICGAILRERSHFTFCESERSGADAGRNCLTTVETHELRNELCTECHEASWLSPGADTDVDNDNGGVSLSRPQSNQWQLHFGFRFSRKVTRPRSCHSSTTGNTVGGRFGTQPMKTESHLFGVPSNASCGLCNNQSKETTTGLFGASTRPAGGLFNNQREQTATGLFGASTRPSGGLFHDRYKEAAANGFLGTSVTSYDGLFNNQSKETGTSLFVPPTRPSGSLSNAQREQTPASLFGPPTRPSGSLFNKPLEQTAKTNSGRISKPAVTQKAKTDSGRISKPSVTQKAKLPADKALESVVQEFRRTCDNIIDCLEEGYASIENSSNAESALEPDAKDDSQDAAASTDTISSTGAELDPMEQIDAEYGTWFGGNDSALNAPAGRCPCPICTDVDSKVDI